MLRTDSEVDIEFMQWVSITLRTYILSEFKGKQHIEKIITWFPLDLTLQIINLPISAPHLMTDTCSD